MLSIAIEELLLARHKKMARHILFLSSLQAPLNVDTARLMGLEVVGKIRHAQVYVVTVKSPMLRLHTLIRCTQAFCKLMCVCASVRVICRLGA